MRIVNEIFDLFEKRGGTAYFGEPVSIIEHCLEAAHLAENAKESSSLVVAALLHDIGHLIHNLPQDIGNRGIDSKHEDLACEWLSSYFSPEITEPIRLHVAAKRYLCHVDPSYLRQLSPASMLSLSLQGGPLVDDAAEDFVRSPYSRHALLIRRWDDSAKIPGLDVPGLQHYRSLVESTVGRNVT